MKTIKKIMTAAVAVAVAAAAWAGGVTISLDTRKGTRAAGEVETFVIDPAWSGISNKTDRSVLSLDGAAVKTFTGKGEYVWEVPKEDGKTVWNWTLQQDGVYYTAKFANYEQLTPINGTIKESTTLTKGATYLVNSSITVASGATLTIPAGTILKMGSGVTITVASGATLDAQGTISAPVVFTSYRDDEHGGDTNDDGNKTMPGAGDWGRIYAGGTVKMNYCQIMYLNNTSDQGAIQGSGGTVTFDNSLIRESVYECVRMNSGSFKARNSVFAEASMGFGYYGGSGTYCYNCVIANVSVGCRSSNKHFYNTVFYNCQAFTDQGGDSSTYNNCLFYNRSGFGAQSYTKVGSSGNIWGDPKFADADNFDFTIAADSPCVDAGDGTVAPARDYYGRPRMNVRSVADTGKANADGVCPDIGIYEVTGVAAGEAPDLTVVAVSAPATAKAGDTITVSYVVSNASQRVECAGAVRDEVAFIGADAALGGRSVSAGMVEQQVNLKGGAAATFTAKVTVPPLASGAWKVAVTANAGREIYEMVTANNRGTADAATAVTLSALAVGSGLVKVPAEGAVGYALTGLPLAGGSVVVTAAEGAKVAAFGANGYMPTEGRHDFEAVDLGGGKWLVVFPARAEGETAFIAFENAGDFQEVVKVEVAKSSLAILAAAPARLANSGAGTVTLTGTGLDGAAVTLRRGGAVVATAKVTAVDSARVACEFALKGVAEGSYEVTAASALGTATWPVEVFAPKTGPKLSARLDVPASVRDGRVFTGWVRYENIGDEPMNAPIFIVRSGESTTKLGLSVAGGITNATLNLVGTGATHPAGILQPGESGSVPFLFTTRGAYNLTLDHCKEGEGGAPSAHFTDRADYMQAMSDTATRLCLRGRRETDANRMFEFEVARRNGQPVAAVSGLLLSSLTREPIPNAAIQLCSSNDVAVTATTDKDGYFQICNLPDDEYGFVIDNGAELITTNLIVMAGQDDLNGMTVLAIPGGTVSGHVYTEAGVPLEGAAVTLAHEGGCREGTVYTDADGRFKFEGLLRDAYAVGVAGSGGYVGDVATNIVVEVTDLNPKAEFHLAEGGQIRGVVIIDGAVATNGYVQAVLQSGGTVETGCGTNGVYVFGGLEPATYAVRYISEEYASEDVDVEVKAGTETVRNLTAVTRPIFYSARTVGFGELETWFSLCNPARAEKVTAYAWDFDSDGVVDSTEANPTYTYTELGNYDVTLRITEEGGKVTESVYRDCVRVEKELPTVYKSNAFDMTKTSMTCVSMTEGGLVLSGTPPFTITAGTVILGQKGEEWFLRRVLTASKSGTQWTLTTEQAKLTDLYESYSLSTIIKQEESDSGQARRSMSVSATPEERSAGQARKMMAASSNSGSPLKGQAYVSGGISASVGLKFDTMLDIVQKIQNGKEYLKVALVGTAGIDLTLKGTGKVGGKLGKKWEVALPQIPIPAAIPLTVGPEAELEITGSLEGALTGSGTVALNSTVRTGVEIIDGETRWLPPSSFGLEPKGWNWDISGKGSVKVAFKPKVKFTCAFLSTLKFNTELYVGATYKAGLRTPPKFDITAGVAVGYEANVFESPWKLIKFKLGVDGSVNLYSTELCSWTGPVPDFTYTPLVYQHAPATVHFLDNSTGDIFNSGIPGGSHIRRTYNVKSYLWDLGEMSSTEANPIHTYIKEGVYPVSLKVKGYLISGPMTKEDKIVVGKRNYDPPAPYTCDGRGSGAEAKSCDPNEMAGPEGVGEERYVKPGDWMSYTVFFENKTNATAAAQEVFVTNNLSAYLDWSTFELGEVAFNGQVETGLAGKAGGTMTVAQDGSPYQVQVKARLDGATGQAVWYLRSYDPARSEYDYWPEGADAGFLPPNDETHRGEGHLTYRVKVREDAPVGAIIEAAATIVFDYNEPIPTDPSWWNTVGAESAVAKFASGEVECAEGESATVEIHGGNYETNSSVKVYLTYNTAAAADFVMPKTLKFPLTLTWGAGEVGTKTIEIPTKLDTAVEADEFLTLQLAEPVNMELGEESVCSIIVRDANSAATLQDAVDNAVVKMSTGGKGKWAAATVAGAPGRGCAAVSPALKKGEASALTAASLKGPGTLSFDVRVAGGGESAKTALALWDGKTLVKKWENATEWTSASHTVSDTAAHVFKFEVTQGSDLEARAYVANVVWTPAGATMRKVTIATEPETFGEGGVASGSGMYPDRTKVTLAAKPRPGWVFAGWFDAKGALVSAKASYAVTLAGDLAVKAVFTQIPYVRGIAMPAEGGKVAGSALVAAGKKATLKATANKGWAFTHWTSEGEFDGEQNPSITLANVAGDMDFVANFKRIEEIPLPEVATPEEALFARVGVDFEYELGVASETLPAVKAAGLPGGLKAAGATIAGVPTKAGDFVTKIDVSNARGKAETKLLRFHVEALPASVVGSFDGHVETPDVYIPFGRRGVFTLTATAAGKLSAKIVSTNGTTAVAANSFAAEDEDGVFHATLTTKKGETMEVAIDSNADWMDTQLMGTLAGGVFGEKPYNIAARRNPFGKSGKVYENDEAQAALAKLKGYYTGALYLNPKEEWSSGKAGNVPEGHGYLTVTVKDGGVATVAGMLPDGTKLSASTVVAPYWYGLAWIELFVPQYSGKGFWAGSIIIMPNDTGKDLYGEAWWYYPGKNPAGKPPAVEDRFDVKEFICGGWYNTVANLAEYYTNTVFLAAEPPVGYVYSKGGWTSEAEVSNFVNAEEITADARGNLTIPAAKAPVYDKVSGEFVYSATNAACVTFAATKATGLFKGAFNTYYEYTDEKGVPKLNTVKSAYQGVLTPWTADSYWYGYGLPIGWGFYQMTEDWTDASAAKPVKYTLKPSAAVEVQTKE